MSIDLVLKGFFVMLYSSVFAWLVFSRSDKEVGTENFMGEKRRYMPYVFGAVLPLFLLVLVIFGFALYGAAFTAQLALSMCFSIFLHISLYYAVLMLLLPLLRRRISARACAVLWLLPNYLYLTTLSSMKVSEPLWVIRVAGNWVWVLFGIWFIGFVTVLLWNIVSHLQFRRKVLKGAYPVTVDEPCWDLWVQEIMDGGIRKPDFKLMISPNISSPLTVGLFRRTTKVLLPERPYSMEELQLIFRHEVIHIGREDCWSKFFLLFCAAMCWFNPLMWIAMRKSAEDLELSCDETALLGADGEKRRQYADLILTTAGEGRGFTSCLSAAASSMRYRLKSIVKPGQRRSGAIIVGLTFFVLCMTCGYTALAYGGSTGEEVLFKNRDHSEIHVRSISLRGDEFQRIYTCTDEAAFLDYLAGLELDHLTGNYSFSEAGKRFCYVLDAPHYDMVIDLFDRAIKVVPLAPNLEATYYYLPEGVDWDYLDTIIVEYPALNLHLTASEKSHNRNLDISATLEQVAVEENGGERILYESGRPKNESPSGVIGYKSSEAVFSFSQPLAGPFTVEMENWNRTSRKVVSQDELDDPYVLPLPSIPVHCKVSGDFLGNDGRIYKAEFLFEIGEMDS
ncbi:MAG: M56 family metallopeptidase [Acutalibacter sp.]|nr:M56 family metallopeptidase [Acutalibacter sp.]